jgi:hypothetical protein
MQQIATVGTVQPDASIHESTTYKLALKSDASTAIIHIS